MKIYFIRHGETDWNLQKRLQGQEDIPMNAAGQEQAAQCAKYLSAYWKAAGLSKPIIVTSPLSRARDTAAQIAKALDIPETEMIQDNALMERDYGRYSGMTYEERAELEKSHADTPEIESREHTARRVWHAVDVYREKCRLSGRENLILVTHGGCIRSALRAIAEAEIDWDVLLLNAGITILEDLEGRFQLVEHNQSAETLLNSVVTHI